MKMPKFYGVCTEVDGKAQLITSMPALWTRKAARDLAKQLTAFTGKKFVVATYSFRKKKGSPK